MDELDEMFVFQEFFLDEENCSQCEHYISGRCDGCDDNICDNYKKDKKHERRTDIEES